MLQTRLIAPADNAHNAPLLIKRLLLSGIRYEKTREIVYRDQLRYSYATLNERVARLANVLTEAGVKAGDTVAVMDWDSHRYLECMFAIPMIGAVLHTINIRLSADQILYTMNHADDKFVLVNSEFVPLYKGIESQLTTVEKTILLTDAAEKTADLGGLVGEYENLLAAASPRYDFPDFDENSVATTFYTTGTTGNPKGVYFSHRQLVLHTMAEASVLGSLDSIRLLGTNDVYMPITPMFHVHAWGIPYVATMLGIKQVYPGRYEPDLLCRLIKDEKVTFSHCVPTILQMLLNAKAAQGVDFGGWKIVIGGSALNRTLYEASKARGIQLTAAYGMSETGPLVWMAREVHSAAATTGSWPLRRRRGKRRVRSPSSTSTVAAGMACLKRVRACASNTGVATIMAPTLMRPVDPSRATCNASRVFSYSAITRRAKRITVSPVDVGSVPLVERANSLASNMRSISPSVFDTAGWLTDRNCAVWPRCLNWSRAISNCRCLSLRLERRTRSMVVVIHNLLNIYLSSYFIFMA